MVVRASLFSVVAVGLVAVTGCSWGQPANQYPTYDYGTSAAGPTFNDDAESNTTALAADLELEFIDVKGNKVALTDLRGKRNAVLVFTRGIPETTGQVCPFRTAQTSRLATNYHEFAKRDAEVLAVFPGDASHVDDFLAAVKAFSSDGTSPSFPIVLDEKFAAVDQLGIRGDLAKPSTFILDRQGQVRFAYVGSHVGDRPSVKALLRQLDMLKGEGAPAAPSAESR